MTTRKRRNFWRVIYLTAGLCAIGLVADRSAPAQEPTPAILPSENFPQNEGTEDVVPLDSGPVHEAFAEPITLDTQPDVVVQQQPPEPVPELPPETRPQGDNVQWIPGYWSWSEESDDFVWISGTWRDVPPGQRWVPGYWSETGDGYRWVHGFWTSDQSEELLYLPAPPQSLDVGPSSPPPGPDYFYVPGCWRWNQQQYAWRPGIWYPAQANWLWVPAHYHYTPRGYVYLNGYWDYPLARRGLLFAPVRFGRPIYRQPGYYYTPRSWIDVGLLTASLFVSPRRGHYFYGNYYGSRFASAGYYPWFDYHTRRAGYDPLFVYASRNLGGRDGRWLDNLRQDYRRFGDLGPNAPRDITRGPDPGPRPGLDGNRGPNGKGPDGIRDQGDRPRMVRNLDALNWENVTKLSDVQRRQAVDQSTAQQSEFRKRRSEIEAQPGRVDSPFRGLTGRDRVEGRSPGDGLAAQPGRGAPDLSQPDRSGRPPFDRARGDLPRANQPFAIQPRLDQPRAGQPRNVPGADQGRTTIPHVRQPGALQPDGRQPRADQFPQQRPVGPPQGRFQMPQQPNRGFTPGNRGGGQGIPGSNRQAVPSQPRQGPGNSQSRGNFNRGGGGPPGGGAQRAPQSRGPAINQGGGHSGGPGKSGGGGHRGK